jgi:hypothetical protein
VTIQDLEQRLLSGDRAALARSITLIESSRADHQRLAQELLNNLATKVSTKEHSDEEHAGGKRRVFANGYSIRIGIAGPPGMQTLFDHSCLLIIM